MEEQHAALVAESLIVLGLMFRTRGIHALSLSLVGLEDRDSLRVLHGAFAPANGATVLTRRFTTSGSTSTRSARPVPAGPRYAAERVRPGHALVPVNWLPSGRTKPVACTAQLGRDHRKYGVRQEHYAQACARRGC